ncbi:MAG: hypothetical protein ACREJO_02065 [Phycisphaerales bacterium]
MAATISLPLLERAKVAAPCPAKWEDMTGDNKVRHCALCNLNVHNFSAMSRDEAELLLTRHFNPDGSAIAGAGRVCGGFYRRADGTHLLQDCPTGLAALRAKVRWAWLRLAAAIGLVSSAALAIDGAERSQAQRNPAAMLPGAVAVSPPPPGLKQHQPFRFAWAMLKPTAPTPVTTMVRGEIYVPPPRNSSN